MSGWISNAANVFRRDVPETPQPFETVCECGQSHSGLRRGRHQQIVCKGCGASLFILPRDVYPPPHVSKRGEKPERTDEPEGDGEDEGVYRLETLLPDPEPERPEVEHPRAKRRTEAVLEAEEVVPLPPKKKTKRQRERDKERQQFREERERRRGSSPIAEPSGPGFFAHMALWFAALVTGAWRGFLGFWSPLRLVTLGVVVIIVLTAVRGIQQSRRVRADVVAKESWERGLEAVNEGKWVVARNEFEEAASAVDLLRRHDVEAERIRQYFRETRAMTRISALSLFDLLSEAVDVTKKHGREEWERQFAISHRGTWMTIEGSVIRNQLPPLNEKSPPVTRYEIPFPWSPADDVSVLVDASFPVFEKLVPPARPVELVFAGELDECRLSEDGKRWTVRFKPETGFLWAHLDTYRGLGFLFDAYRPEDEVKHLLETQSRVMGVVQ